MNSCPCGSGKALATCCQPYISGLAKSPSAEALMRSRYTAYATHATDYILKSTTERGGKNVDPDATREWAENSTWHGLRIVRTVAGGPTDVTGEVEFIASYSQDDKKEEHHEYSYFKKEKGEWRYDSGRMVTDTVVRDQPKVGRNDLCPCGSGKKYKVCHGRA